MRDSLSPRSINNLRSDLRSLLEEMGNTIVSAGDGGDEATSRWMKAAGIAIDEEHYRKVANAKDIDRRTYTSRQHQDYLKPEEVLDYRHRQREDRERKRQESLERDAARMQAQYGVEQRSRSLWQEPITRNGGAEEQRGKNLYKNYPLHPCSPAPLPSSSPSTPPNNESGSNNRGGMDTDEELSVSWWEGVKYYAQLAIERFQSGVEGVKELLSTLTSDERWGVMLKFEDIEAEKFGQLIAIAPDWVEWMA